MALCDAGHGQHGDVVKRWMIKLINLFTRKNALLFFVKYWELKSVKTRLASIIGEEQAAGLYRCFVLDMIKVFSKLKSKLYVFYCPPDAETHLKNNLKIHRGLHPQRGEDLGRRMWNALEYAFSRGHRRVVLVGSDIPELSAEILREAYSALGTHDAVLGPAGDGGYYCIGFREGRARRCFFENMNWSTSMVLKTTADRIKDTGLTLHMLPRLHDIDTIYDLRKYFERSLRSGNTGTITMKYLMELREGL